MGDIRLRTAACSPVLLWRASVNFDQFTPEQTKAITVEAFGIRSFDEQLEAIWGVVSEGGLIGLAAQLEDDNVDPWSA